MHKILTFVITLMLVLPLQALPIDEAIKAAKAGDLVQLKRLVSQSPALIDAGDDKNRTPLMWAACAGHLEVVRYLIGEQAALNTITYHKGMTALLYAADKGHLEIIQALANAGADLNVRESECNDTALERAIFNGHYHIADLLIEKGAKCETAAKLVEQYSGEDFPAQIKSYCAHQACKKNQLSQLKKFIEKYKVSVNATDDRNRTFLLWASYKGYIDIVNYSM